MPSDREVVLEAAVPILSVTDISEALDYYENVLGFQVGWSWGEPARLVSLCRNRVELNISHSSPDVQLNLSKVYVQLSGVDAYYNRVTTAGAKVLIPLADRSYGMRDFRIVDPSGNELSFGEATAS